MKRVKVKLKEMRDADVTKISLVERSASRMPIRILKQEKDMLDLSKLGTHFTKKGEKETTSVPVADVTAVFVLKQEDAEADEKVRQSIASAGFAVDNSVPVQGDALVITYAQKAEEPLKDTVIVRLNEQVAIAVKGFQPQHPDMEGADFSDDAASKGFYPSIDRSLDTLFNKICTALHSASDQAAAVKQVTSLCDGFKSYAVDLVKKLPQAAFKMEGSILQAIEEVAVAKEEKAAKEAAAKAEAEAAAAKETGSDEDDKEKSMTKPDHISAEDWEKMSDEDKEKACAKKAEEPVTPTAPVEPAVKLEDVMAAIKEMATKQASIETQVTELVAKQGDLQNKVDSAVQKSETVSQLVQRTVTAPPVPADNFISKGEKTVVTDDMGTGLFDSATFNRAKKYDKLVQG